MQETKSSQLEGKRQALEDESKNAAPGNKILVEIALATLEAQIAILGHIERNVRN